MPAFCAAATKPRASARVAADVAVEARGQLGGRDLVGGLEGLGRVAVGVARLHRELVGLGQDRLLAELVVEPPEGRVHRTVVEPVAHAEREEVLAPVHALGVEAELAQGGARELGQLHREEAVPVEGVVLERALRHLRLLEVGLLEVVDVDDEDAVRAQVGDVHLERRRVHRDERVHGVARGEDVLGTEVDLEPGDPGQGAGGGADLGREVGKGGEVVAEEGGGVRELAAGDLHAVTGVAAKADDGRFEDLTLSRRRFDGGRHLSPLTCGRPRSALPAPRAADLESYHRRIEAVSTRGRSRKRLRTSGDHAASAWPPPRGCRQG